MGPKIESKLDFQASNDDYLVHTERFAWAGSAPDPNYLVHAERFRVVLSPIQKRKKKPIDNSEAY